MTQNKSSELAKLFDAVVAFQREPDNDFLREVMQEQKRTCQIVWPEQTLHTCKQAMAYVERFPQ